MAMLSDVRSALRISSNAFDSELEMYISACKTDLKGSGLKTISETDNLTKVAIIKYCRAEMNYQGNGDKWKEAYREQKIAMGLNGDYNEETSTT